MSFLGRKHKLPTFPDHIIPGFQQMCVPIEAGKISELRMELFDYMGQVEKEYSDNSIVNLELARDISQRASYLLDRYEEFDQKKRGLIIAAISYFISDGDGVYDFDFGSGLNDDAQVMNLSLIHI